MPEAGKLIRIDKTRARLAAEVLARAFFEYPALQYYFPHETERRRIVLPFVGASVYVGIKHGEVYATPDLGGVAVWLPSANYPITLWKAFRSIPVSIQLDFIRYGGARMMRLDNHLISTHQRLASFPHWVLEAIGAEPALHGQGYGGRLLKPMLARFDAKGMPVYLDTANERRVSLYEHFGFKVIDKSVVPGTTLTSWAMLREAK